MRQHLAAGHPKNSHRGASQPSQLIVCLEGGNNHGRGTSLYGNETKQKSLPSLLYSQPLTGGLPRTTSRLTIVDTNQPPSALFISPTGLSCLPRRLSNDLHDEAGEASDDSHSGWATEASGVINCRE